VVPTCRCRQTPAEGYPTDNKFVFVCSKSEYPQQTWQKSLRRGWELVDLFCQRPSSSGCKQRANVSVALRVRIGLHYFNLIECVLDCSLLTANPNVAFSCELLPSCWNTDVFVISIEDSVTATQLKKLYAKFVRKELSVSHSSLLTNSIISTSG
jgi:hypothetical protein